MMNDSRLMYLHKMGVYVGEFTDEEMTNGSYDAMVKIFKTLTGLKHEKQKIAKGDEGEKVTRVWLCKEEDLEV